ncbi:ABC transporter substrate-binding protein, partial [Frankia sp. KB5]
MGRRYGLRWLAAAVLGAVLAGTLAACGGDSDGEATGTSSAGSTVKLMIIAPVGTSGTNYPEMVAAARAAVRGVNARGGIAGHRVELVHCNEKNDAAVARKCAQQAVDQHVLAVVGEVSGSGGIMPILENAGIPSIGSAGISADGSELSSPISYVISPL